MRRKCLVERSRRVVNGGERSSTLAAPVVAAVAKERGCAGTHCTVDGRTTQQRQHLRPSLPPPAAAVRRRFPFRPCRCTRTASQSLCCSKSEGEPGTRRVAAGVCHRVHRRSAGPRISAQASGFLSHRFAAAVGWLHPAHPTRLLDLPRAHARTQAQYRRHSRHTSHSAAPHSVQSSR